MTYLVESATNEPSDTDLDNAPSSIQQIFVAGPYNVLRLTRLVKLESNNSAMERNSQLGNSSGSLETFARRDNSSAGISIDCMVSIRRSLASLANAELPRKIAWEKIWQLSK